MRHPARRTEAQKAAAERDGKWCLWSLVVEGVQRPLEEVHHIFGRGRVDTMETCIGLSLKIHQSHHQHNRPTTQELVALMQRVYGYDYSEYQQFFDPIDN